MSVSTAARASRAPWVRGVAVALIAAAVAAGCGGGSPSAAPSSAAAVFIDLLSALPRSLDPADEQGAAFERVESSLAGTLVRPVGAPPAAATRAPADAVTGFLASSWRELAGGDYVFELRSGVRSAYGDTLSGADVSFSFERELAHSATARFLAGRAKIELVDPITVLGPRRVRLNVTGAGPLALAVLGGFRFAVLDSRAVRAHESAGDPSAHSWLSDHLAFYGAYELTRFVPAERLLARANPHFWWPLAFTHLAIEAVPSSSLRLGEVAAAAASHTSQLDWPDFETAARTSALRAVTLASSAVSTLVPDERFRPFASVLVRRALSLTIDRPALARAAFAGAAKPALQPEPSTFPSLPGVREPTYGHDVALARALLARAGYPRGFSFVQAASDDDGPEISPELAAITRQLRAIGVSVTARRVATSAELAALERDGVVGAVLESVATPIASASFAIVEDYLRDSPANLEAYDSPALDRLAGPLTSSRPAAASRAALQRALHIVAASYPAIGLVEIPAQEVTRAQIGGYAAYAAAATYYDRLTR